jgi:hypothetical protein
MKNVIKLFSILFLVVSLFGVMEVKAQLPEDNSRIVCRPDGFDFMLPKMDVTRCGATEMSTNTMGFYFPKPIIGGDINFELLKQDWCWTKPMGDISFKVDGITKLIVKGANGWVGVNTKDPKSQFHVEGTIRAHEVRVCINQGCDYVFAKDYKLMSLSDLSKFIETNKHLPEVAPAVEMEAEGINVSEMSALLLKKIEELTLYTIEQQKLIEELQKRLAELEEKKGGK